MRAIWKGSVSFGLVNVPVKLYGATEQHDVELHQVHAADGGRIRYQRVCESCGNVIEYADITRGYDEDGRTVVLTKEDLAALPAEKSREIAIRQFVPRDQLSPLMLAAAYYLLPETSGRKPYALLVRTLAKTDRIAIATLSLRQRTRLAALTVIGGVLVAQTLRWADEVRAIEAPEEARVTKQEVEMAQQLVAAYSSDFEPEQYTDDYQDQLRTLVEAKLEAGDAFDSAATFGESDEQPGEVIDLMEALRRSVARSRSAS